MHLWELQNDIIRDPYKRRKSKGFRAFFKECSALWMIPMNINSSDFLRLILMKEIKYINQRLVGLGAIKKKVNLCETICEIIEIIMFELHA